MGHTCTYQSWAVLMWLAVQKLFINLGSAINPRKMCGSRRFTHRFTSEEEKGKGGGEKGEKPKSSFFSCPIFKDENKIKEEKSHGCQYFCQRRILMLTGLDSVAKKSRVRAKILLPCPPPPPPQKKSFFCHHSWW